MIRARALAGSGAETELSLLMDDLLATGDNRFAFSGTLNYDLR
jgi:hypothetical protein